MEQHKTDNGSIDVEGFLLRPEAKNKSISDFDKYISYHNAERDINWLEECYQRHEMFQVNGTVSQELIKQFKEDMKNVASHLIRNSFEKAKNLKVSLANLKEIADKKAKKQSSN